MRLTAKLVHVAAILVAANGCGGATTATTPDGGGDGSPTTEGGIPGDGGNPGDSGNPGDGGNPGDSGNPGDDGSPGDAAPDGPIVGCGGCGCIDTGAPQMKMVGGTTACEIVETDFELGSGFGGVDTFMGTTCGTVCGGGYSCELPDTYVSAVHALNSDAGMPSDSGVLTDAGPWECPSTPATVTVTCQMNCTGRLTAGYCAPAGMRDEGERLAAMAYLEAVSVHAFERLECELEVHRAPPALLRAARRARRDEVRHTAMTTRLARQHGASPRLPEAPVPARARALFDVALENAVEGCVRETYGAVQGLVEARTSPDATMRRAMQSIAADECRHAELAWAVHAWAMARLGDDERLAVERAMQDAIAEIAARDPRTASLLFS